LPKLQPSRGDLWKTAGAIYLYDLQDDADALRCFRTALSFETDPAERQKIGEIIGALE